MLFLQQRTRRKSCHHRKRGFHHIRAFRRIHPSWPWLREQLRRKSCHRRKRGQLRIQPFRRIRLSWLWLREQEHPDISYLYRKRDYLRRQYRCRTIPLSWPLEHLHKSLMSHCRRDRHRIRELRRIHPWRLWLFRTVWKFHYKPAPHRTELQHSFHFPVLWIPCHHRCRR